MSYGLQTYDNNGNIKLTQDKKLCRLIKTVIAPANESGSTTVDLQGVTNPSFIALMMDSDSYYRHMPHTVTLDSTTGSLSWEPNAPATSGSFDVRVQFVSSATKILVFGYG